MHPTWAGDLTAIFKAFSDSRFAFLHFFFLWMVLIPASCILSPTSVHSSSVSLSDLQCQLLLYKVVTQPYVYIYPLPLKSLSRHPHSTHLGLHREPDWTPVLNSSFRLAIYFTHGSVYMSMSLSQFIPCHHLLPSVHKSFL